MLNQAVDHSFGLVNFGDPDFGFVEQLKYNNAVFSAFKTHQQQKELHAELFDDQGRVRSFSEYRKATAPILGKYNVTWLQTEYNTAVKRAQHARQLREMDRDRESRPNFQWLPSTAVEPRAEHKALYYIVWPLDDPFLKANYPGNLWGCLCSGKSTTEAATDRSVAKAAAKEAPDPAPGLDQNPGRSGALFSDTHPYRASCGKREQKVVALACDKLMSERSRLEVRQFFKDRADNSPIAINNGPIGLLSIGYQDIKTITGKPHKFNYARNQACYHLPELLKQAKYEGSSLDIKPGQNGHESILRWHYYAFDLYDEPSYVVVKETHDGVFRVHNIQDTDHFKKGKIQKKP